MASNQHEVSVRSRNQYSVVGDSGEVIQIEASGACRRRARALVCRNPARLGATGAANESRWHRHFRTYTASWTSPRRSS